MSTKIRPDLIPLCVDLDGTLTATDTLFESVISALKSNIFLFFLRNNIYYSLLKNCNSFGKPSVSERATHNGHIFYIMLKSKAERDKTIKQLNEYNISTVFHFIPLHSSPAGKKFGRFNGEDIYTTSCSERIIRLPLFNDLWDSDIEYICDKLIRIVG